jgi:hypothetical protein
MQKIISIFKNKLFFPPFGTNELGEIDKNSRFAIDCTDLRDMETGEWKTVHRIKLKSNNQRDFSTLCSSVKNSV